ncbi:MAG: hypothetical protein ABIY51_14150 [Ferruginibacter sp.]
MKLIFQFMLGLLFTCQIQAQDNILSVDLSNGHPAPGDTLWAEINYTVNNKLIPAASAFLVMINDKGYVWNMRWPLLKGNAQPGIILPKGMAAGNYQMYFAARDNFFKLKGQVKKPAGIKQLHATLLAGSGDGIVSNIPVSAKGDFVYNNLLFEDEARLLFSAKLNPEDLDIVIKTELDSAFLPSARVMKEFYIGEKTNRPVLQFNLDSLFMDAYSLLPAVILSSSKATSAEKINKRYTSPMFNDINEKIIVVREDENARYSNSLLQYIKRKIPGLQSRRGFDGQEIFSWRSDMVLFYMDEMKVDASTFYSIPIEDVILIKAFPSPFFGNTGGTGAAIVVYTDRGDIKGQSKHNFTIKGYTAMLIGITANGSAL